jgi:3-keto-disaccharide hydrolase
MKLCFRACVFAIAAGWGIALARADDSAGCTMSLFNGENLDGWVVTGCKAGVEDGLLVLQAGDGFVRTEQDYGDFVLELDWRARKPSDWDSGVYFRAELPPEGKPWPARYQVNLQQNKEGNVNGLAGAESKGLAKAGEWNHFRLLVVGSQAELSINGRLAWKVSGIEPNRGYVGLQSEVDKGGEFEFRNLRITELDHHWLFNGRDLTGWEGADKEAAACWKVDKGELLCTGKPGPWLRSKSEYGDFNLRLDYKLKPGGNSGVYVRVPRDGDHRGKELSGGKSSGIEIQMLDDDASQYRDLKPYQFSGSLYAIVAADPRVSRPAGRWNSMEIDCRGTRYRVVHNGRVVVDAGAKQYAELGERLVRGYLGLQNHNEEVWFRNIRIAEAP